MRRPKKGQPIWYLDDHLDLYYGTFSGTLNGLFIVDIPKLCGECIDPEKCYSTAKAAWEAFEAAVTQKMSRVLGLLLLGETKQKQGKKNGPKRS